MPKPDTVIFDLGGVLIDWNPRYLYRKIFSTEEEVSWFLENVCTPEWNEQQDAGRPFEEATLDLQMKFPQHKEAIRAWYDRWEETIGGPIDETVKLLSALRQQKQHRLYALTNWSAETFPWAKKTFDFLHWFEGIVVSGEEGMVKPQPAFYRVLLDRYGINAASAVFIDDNFLNVEGARAVGIDGVHFRGADQLRQDLEVRGILRGLHD
jgi:2-haloacid dehalogenase